MGVSGKDVLNLVFMLVSSSVVASGPLMAGTGGQFRFHPVLMGIGFTLLLSLGFWMFNYEDLPGEWIDSRPSRRKMHAAFQLSGVLCIGAGYVFAVRAHTAEGQALFAVSESASFSFVAGPSWLRLAHVWLGYVVLLFICVQVVIGVLKYRVVTDEEEGNDNAFTSHKTVGSAIYILGMTNLLLGVWLWGAWTLPIQCMLTLTLITSMAFGPRWDGGKGYLAEETDFTPHHHHHHKDGPSSVALGAAQGSAI